jgi:formylglycine-generating enzyme required for sulfatase activity
MINDSNIKKKLLLRKIINPNNIIIMKKLFYLLVTLVLFSVVFFSCQDKVTITGIKISHTDLLLGVGKTATISANVLPYDAATKMNWTSIDNNVVALEFDDKTSASVSKCVVTGKAKGTVIITVSTKDGNHSATCTVIVDNGEPELISVEGGTFMMGGRDGTDDVTELPVHEVRLSGFKIAKYPVTQQQWKVVMENNPSYDKGDNLPVTNVTWNDAQEFIKKLNAATGKNYRLPTEAEWEFAARGGNKSKNYVYSGSNNIDEVAWYRSNSLSSQPVGTKMPNELDIYDMSGNVWEWCSDWAALYTADLQENPQGPSTGTHRIMRGGSAGILPFYCRVACRIPSEPTIVWSNVGFRLAHP